MKLGNTVNMLFIDHAELFYFYIWNGARGQLTSRVLERGLFCFSLLDFLVGLARIRRCAMKTTCLPLNFFSSSRTSLRWPVLRTRIVLTKSGYYSLIWFTGNRFLLLEKGLFGRPFIFSFSLERHVKHLLSNRTKGCLSDRVSVRSVVVQEPLKKMRFRLQLKQQFWPVCKENKFFFYNHEK